MPDVPEGRGSETAAPMSAPAPHREPGPKTALLRVVLSTLQELLFSTCMLDCQDLIKEKSSALPQDKRILLSIRIKK